MSKNTVVVGEALRTQVYDLMRLAEKLDDQKPFLVTTETGAPVMIWHHEMPTAAYAASLMGAANGAVTSILPLSLRSLSGTLKRMPAGEF